MILTPLSQKSSLSDRLYLEGLITSAFPKAEYRDMELMHRLIENEARFHACLIKKDGNQNVGLINYWDFLSFIYIEHLAVEEGLRNQGIGAAALKALRACHPGTPLFLEAETPIGTLEKRRIAFYTRCGFMAMPHEYLQPPYRKGEEPIEMSLLAMGGNSSMPTFEEVRMTLYREAYLLDDEGIDQMISAGRTARQQPK